MKIKRILSAFLAGAVVLGSMAIPAFADETTGTTETTKVAKVGSTEYATLQEAVNAAANSTDNTVKLLSNASGDGVVTKDGQTVIIDLSGYTYTVNGKLVGSDG